VTPGVNGTYLGCWYRDTLIAKHAGGATGWTSFQAIRGSARTIQVTVEQGNQLVHEEGTFQYFGPLGGRFVNRCVESTTRNEHRDVRVGNTPQKWPNDFLPLGLYCLRALTAPH
jgi:hypothetical protein